MILGYLLFAHLLADFVLQPKKLVLWKIKSKDGIIVHALIHFFTNVLILLPIIIIGNYWLIAVAFIISFIHFWIDEAKISYDLNHDQKLIPFLLDQFMHLLTILLVYFFISNIVISLPAGDFYTFYQDIRVNIFLSFLVLVSTTVDIYRFQKIREKDRKAKLNFNLDGILTRVMVLCLLYGLFILLGFYARGNGGF